MKLKLVVALLIVAASLITTCVAQDACAMNAADKQSAVNTTFTNLRDQPFCELILWCNNAGGVYTPQGLKNEPCNSGPNSLCSCADLKALAKQYNADSATINPTTGTKFWILDKMEIPVSPTVRDFNSLKVHWWAEMAGETEMPPYEPAPIARKSVWTFEKSKPVFLMDDPTGITWILKNYVSTPDKNMTYESLSTLNTKLKPPAGWKNFRTKVLDQDLKIIPVNGMARIMWDEFGASWDALDPGVANFQP